MSKKRKQPQQSEKKGTENYYKLNTEAVDRLVNAKDAPEVSEAEIRKYKSGGKFKIPTWLKIIFVKFWFGGAVCYFFLWGLGNYLTGLDKLAVVALGLGMVTDLMVNHVMRALETEKGEYDKWIMVGVRKWWSIFLNVIYAGVLLFCIINMYTAINYILYGSPENSENVLGVEPLLFGLMYCLFDLLFITMKNTLKKIIRDAEKNVSQGKK